ncbi:MAG: hypothetical protein GYA15_15245 [Leptolinea sp.]|jgi:CO/xanthine dehydrogenase FAD-binding subunit|nr:hypothetical protein [Leptolinea sp.]
MIIEYHRPENLDQAKRLLDRTTPLTIPLGGGTVISRHTDVPVAVVDLQSLGLNKVSIVRNTCRIGAMTRLQDLVENMNLPGSLRRAALREANINIRRSATIGGLLMKADGHSPLLGCLLSLDINITWEPGKISVSLEDWLKRERQKKPGKLITEITFTIPVETGYEDVARSPQDRPIVFVTTTRWETGGVRIVFGGSGNAPVLASESYGNKIIEFFSKRSLSDQIVKSEYSDYQRAAIQILIKRTVQQKEHFGGKELS